MIKDEKVYSIRDVIPDFGKRDPGKKLRGYLYREGLSPAGLSLKTGISAMEITSMMENKLQITEYHAKLFEVFLNVDYKRFL